MVGAVVNYFWVEPEFDAVVVVRWVDSAHLPDFMTRMCEALATAA